MAAAEAERELSELRRRKEAAAHGAHRAQTAPIARPRPSVATVSPGAARSGSDCFSLLARPVLSQAWGEEEGGKRRVACLTEKDRGRGARQDLLKEK